MAKATRILITGLLVLLTNQAYSAEGFILKAGNGEPLLNGTDVHTEPGLVAGVGRR